MFDETATRIRTRSWGGVSQAYAEDPYAWGREMQVDFEAGLRQPKFKPDQKVRLIKKSGSTITLGLFAKILCWNKPWLIPYSYSWESREAQLREPQYVITDEDGRNPRRYYESQLAPVD